MCLRPIAEFAQSGLPADVLQSVSGFKAPSPIQAQAWPLVLQGLDMIGIAATGSGAPPCFCCIRSRYPFVLLQGVWCMCLRLRLRGWLVRWMQTSSVEG